MITIAIFITTKKHFSLPNYQTKSHQNRFRNGKQNIIFQFTIINLLDNEHNKFTVNQKDSNIFTI